MPRESFPQSGWQKNSGHLARLAACAQDYGFFDCVVVSRESMVSIESNRYSVPVHLVGRALTARIHREHIELFADKELVATHARATGQHERMVNPAHGCRKLSAENHVPASWSTETGSVGCRSPLCSLCGICVRNAGAR